ncbi:uncharacterized protein Jabba isoform X2 [Eurosta solidaginis]|uniref:uncharacterized protein Jabba isoform X2 n=1 Tax=Eurosta solidaginis TaxID=178769 RepID=UPI003530ACDB
MFVAVPTDTNPDQNHDSSNDSGNIMHDALQDLDESTDITPLFHKTYQIMEKMSATHIGQFLLKRGDMVLSTFEETAKWRLPADNPDFYLIRPLPWIPFLFLIIILRILLIYLSIGALLLGDGPVTAKRFIYFIQTRRRKLRCIRMHGLRVIQERENKRKTQNLKVQQNSLIAKMSNLFNKIVCRRRLNNDEDSALLETRAAGVENIMQSKILDELTAKIPATTKSPGLDGSPFMSCTELLNKFANQDSDEDSDYVPANEDDESVNDETNTSDTSDENAKDLSLTEKDQSNDTKSPNQKILPTIDIKPIDSDKTFITDLKNGDDDAYNMETISGDNAKSIIMSPKTPLDNGGTNNGGLAAAVEVVQVHEVAKPQNALFVNLLNGHADVQKKSTPGHETAAHSTPHLPPPLLGNIVNANPTTVGKPVDAIADCFGDLNEIPTNIDTCSPPDFSRFSNAMENPFLFPVNADASAKENYSVDADDVFSKSKHFKADPEPKSQNTKQQQQKYQQRYRNRNRR